MTTDDFTEQARAEADERFPPPKESAVIYPLTAVRSHGRGAFIAGVVWACDHLADQEPTDAAVRAAMRVLYESDGPRDEAVIRSAIREAMKENR